MDDNNSAYDQYVSQLHASAAQGDVTGIVTTLKVVPDVNATNSRGWTALMFAARNGHREAVRTLIDNGCDTTAINGIGQTAKDIAEFWLHEDVATELTHGSQSRNLTDTHSNCLPACHRQHSNYFCDSPLDRSSQRRTDDVWITETSVADSTVYIGFVRLELIVQKSASNAAGGPSIYRPVRFTYRQVKPILDTKQPTVIFLGVDRSSDSSKDNPAWFALDVDISEEELQEICPGAKTVLVHPRMMQLPRTEAAIIGQARSVLAWHDRYRFCPTCGSPTVIKEAGYKRRCTREDCRSNSGVHNTCYPRTDPTVIMAIVSPDGKQLLLGRNRRFPGSMWSCLAGFMEPGEGIEEACRREVMEESGIRVGRVEYHSCQPWPMPSQLMIGCIGHAETMDIKVDKEELEDARWFGAQDVRLMLTNQHPNGFFCPPAQAIAHQLIKHSLSVMSKL